MAETITLGIVGIKNCGIYDANKKYEKLNVVTYNGSTYCSLKETKGNLPTNTDYWQLYAQKGAKGDTGPIGPTGSTGPKGDPSGAPLVASSVSGMRDTARVYVNTTDNKWYYYDGDSWEPGGVYQATLDTDAKKSLHISEDINKYFTLSSNIFNKEDVELGYFLLVQNGRLTEYDNYFVSNYILLKAGESITINKCRVWCTYDLYYNYITGEATGNDTANVTLTATSDEFIRFSTASAYLNSISINYGNAVLDYEKYYQKLNNLEIDDNLLNSISFKELKTKVDTNIIIGDNIFNKININTDKFLTFNNGREIDNSDYFVSNYILLKAGESITINKCRVWCTYDLYYNYITGEATGNNNSSKTITATTDIFVKICNIKSLLDSISINKGTSILPFEEYSVSIPGLHIDNMPLNDSKILVTKNGDSVNLSGYINNKLLEIRTLRSGSTNGSFRFNDDYLDGELFKNTYDDITPFKTFYTVGANHEYPAWKNAKYNLTNADLGSIWSDSSHNFVLAHVDNNYAYFIPSYTKTNLTITLDATTPIANLTHVSGATHTSVITKNGEFIKNGILSIYKKDVDYYLDNKLLEDNGKYYCNNVTIKEDYVLLSYTGLYDYLISHIGVDYTEHLSAIQGAFEVFNTFKYDNTLTCIVDTSLKFLEDTKFENECGFVQSMSIANGTKYLFGVKTKNGLDYANGVDIASINVTNRYYRSDLTNENNLPSYFIDWNNDKNFGFTMGYILENNDIVNRSNLTNSYWEIRDTKKSYPTALSNQSFQAGESLNIKAFRKYIDNLSNFFIKVNDKKYYYINGAKTENNHIDDIVTSSIELANENVIINNSYNLDYNVSKKGYAIYKN